MKDKELAEILVKWFEKHRETRKYSNLVWQVIKNELSRRDQDHWKRSATRNRGCIDNLGGTPSD